MNIKKNPDITVGIAGLGGLGSNIAMMLARSGISRFVLVDFDLVDQSNLNRQHYFPRHLGRLKTECLKEQMMELNPDLYIQTYSVKLDENNMTEIFRDCRIVCEAFDSPECKAELVSTLLSTLPDVIIISGSGMAGSESSNTIQTLRKMKRLYVCGDGTSEVSQTSRLTAPRVQICAGHQANMVLRLLSGIDEP